MYVHFCSTSIYRRATRNFARWGSKPENGHTTDPWCRLGCQLKAKAEIKHVFSNVHLFQRHRPTSISAYMVNQFESSKGDVELEGGSETCLQKSFSITLSRSPENVYLKERLKLEEIKKRNAHQEKTSNPQGAKFALHLSSTSCSPYLP